MNYVRRGQFSYWNEKVVKYLGNGVIVFKKSFVKECLISTNESQ